ncbi:MAG TPA: hypothetical protein PK110_09755 [Niabella sp.]|nr:hypothetical protein [Chitinophagaceae bacterium]HRN48530.1 hypothetical protein [Niabella sp.]HRO85093.1 hypothetical protein [Niabella sp.]
MKTIITYVLLGFLAFTACSKSSPDKSNTNFPNNIASTWSRSAADISSQADTTTDSNTGQKWVKDIVVLTSSEAAKLQTLIQAPSKQIKDDFTAKGKKFIDRISSPEISISSFWESRTNTQEYKDLYKFCIDNREAVLPLAMAFLFNDADATIGGIGVVALDICTEGRFEDLKKEVADERLANQYTEDNKYQIFYSQGSLQRRLAKKILTQL